jgi:hypothetical protein
MKDEQVAFDTFRESKRFCSKCHACKQVLRESFWPSFIYGLTFGAIDLRKSLDETWNRHQEIFNA